MAIQWKESGAKDRLLAAIIAASSNLDMNEVARLFGQGATYDAVEGQLRKAKKAATALKDEAASRPGPAAAPSRAKKTKTVKESPLKTPTFKGARVAKTKKATSSKVETESPVGESMLFDASLNDTDSNESRE